MSADQPSVSVVVGAYNSERWLRQTLDSVLSQTYPVLEVIVVDDGSTDNTAEVAKSAGSKVKCISKPHRGRPYRNDGIRISRGDLVAFVDADDYWRPQKLQKQVDLMLRQRTEWSICDSRWLHPGQGELTAPIGEPVRGGNVLETLFLSNFVVTSSALVSRRALDEVALFDESADAVIAEDWDLWLRLAGRHEVACVEDAEVILRLHSDSLLASTPIAQKVQSQLRVIERASTMYPQRLSHLKRRAIYNIHHSAGVRLFRENELVEARSYFLRALRHRPASLDDIAFVFISLLGKRAATLAKTQARSRRRGA